MEPSAHATSSLRAPKPEVSLRTVKVDPQPEGYTLRGSAGTGVPTLPGGSLTDVVRIARATPAPATCPRRGEYKCLNHEYCASALGALSAEWT